MPDPTDGPFEDPRDATDPAPGQGPEAGVAREIDPESGASALGRADRSDADPRDGGSVGASVAGVVVEEGLAEADSGSRWSRWTDRIGRWFGVEPPRTPRQRARARAIWRGLSAGFGFLVLLSVVKLPMLVMSPGPTYNTIGDVAGVPMIQITGTTTYPTEGNLDMTTVSERGGSSGGVFMGEALIGWISPASTIVPRESVYGPEVSQEDISERNDQLFALSQSDSIAAAMDELGLPTTDAVVVTRVEGGSPADGTIEAGDQIVAVNGEAISAPSEVGDEVRAGEVGDTVTLDVLRAPEGGGQPEEQQLEVVTGANPDAAAEDPDAAPVPYLGILVGTQHTAPFPIDFTLENVGGPSAGMMFSLAIVDMLTDGPMNGGGHVAGTGTIDADGTVGPIGGIRQKLVGARRAGATLFLAPVSNCDEVVGNEPSGLTVVPIGTLDEARSTVEAWAADPDADFPTCEAMVDPQPTPTESAPTS